MGQKEGARSGPLTVHGKTEQARATLLDTWRSIEARVSNNGGGVQTSQRADPRRTSRRRSRRCRFTRDGRNTGDVAQPTSRRWDPAAEHRSGREPRPVEPSLKVQRAAGAGEACRCGAYLVLRRAVIGCVVVRLIADRSRHLRAPRLSRRSPTAKSTVKATFTSQARTFNRAFAHDGLLRTPAGPHGSPLPNNVHCVTRTTFLERREPFATRARQLVAQRAHVVLLGRREQRVLRRAASTSSRISCVMRTIS